MNEDSAVLEWALGLDSEDHLEKRVDAFTEFAQARKIRFLEKSDG
jgi:hypothetical protein